ncbi:lipid asymmetry maintenance protein MlaB [Pseudoalteromonas sp.]|jgi:phospholipid transport system transporter-binding protein|uniref:STAS domain-containing protein n=1 Tax=Pseudoalteromonas sp. TaxID=53249 RepID=UPI0035663163
MTKLVIKPIDEQHIQVSGELTRNSIDAGLLLGSQSLTKHSTYYVDLSQLARVDTAGLAWLIHCFAHYKQQGIRLELQNPPEQLQKLMQLGQVTTLFE